MAQAVLLIVEKRKEFMPLFCAQILDLLIFLHVE